MARLASSDGLRAHEDAVDRLRKHRDAAVRRQAVLCKNLLRRDDPAWLQEHIPGSYTTPAAIVG